MGRCSECPMRDVNCDKMVLAYGFKNLNSFADKFPLPDDYREMSCRDANHHGYYYVFLSERSLEERSEEMLKAGRKPETDVFKKRKDQVEGK